MIPHTHIEKIFGKTIPEKPKAKYASMMVKHTLAVILINAEKYIKKQMRGKKGIFSFLQIASSVFEEAYPKIDSIKNRRERAMVAAVFAKASRHIFIEFIRVNEHDPAKILPHINRELKECCSRNNFILSAYKKLFDIKSISKTFSDFEKAKPFTSGNTAITDIAEIIFTNYDSANRKIYVKNVIAEISLAPKIIEFYNTLLRHDPNEYPENSRQEKIKDYVYRLFFECDMILEEKKKRGCTYCGTVEFIMERLCHAVYTKFSDERKIFKMILKAVILYCKNFNKRGSESVANICYEYYKRERLIVVKNADRIKCNCSITLTACEGKNDAQIRNEKVAFAKKFQSAGCICDWKELYAILCPHYTDAELRTVDNLMRAKLAYKWKQEHDAGSFGPSPHNNFYEILRNHICDEAGKHIEVNMNQKQKDYKDMLDRKSKKV